MTIIASREALSFPFFLNCLLRTNIEAGNQRLCHAIHTSTANRSKSAWFNPHIGGGNGSFCCCEPWSFTSIRKKYLMWKAGIFFFCQLCIEYYITTLSNATYSCHSLTLYFPTNPQQLNGRPENGEVQKQVNDLNTMIIWQGRLPRICRVLQEEIYCLASHLWRQMRETKVKGTMFLTDNN